MIFIYPSLYLVASWVRGTLLELFAVGLVPKSPLLLPFALFSRNENIVIIVTIVDT